MSHVFEQLRSWLLAPVVDRLDLLGELMAITQADLDAVATELVADAGAIQTEIANLQSAIDAGQSLDLTGLRDAVSRVGQLVPSSTGGGEGPVASDPGTPVVADPGAGDGGTTV